MKGRLAFNGISSDYVEDVNFMPQNINLYTHIEYMFSDFFVTSLPFYFQRVINNKTQHCAQHSNVYYIGNPENNVFYDNLCT